jgi:hypothetical protein
VAPTLPPPTGLVDDSGVTVELRQSKYLNNLVEQDHRAVKRRTRPMLGFKDFGSAAKILAGIETSHMIRKGQLAGPEGQRISAADQFYSSRSNRPLRTRHLASSALLSRQSPTFCSRVLTRA